MARQMQRLSAKSVTNIKEPGYYADGGSLYLQVSKPSKDAKDKKCTKSWLFCFTLFGKDHEMGLGPLHAVSLAEARVKATDCRNLLVQKINPIAARANLRMEAALNAANSLTFAQCAEAYIKAHKAGWKNAKHADQWQNTLDTYCGPVIGSLPVQVVNTTHVIRVLEPIWTQKSETASRLRGRIEKVLDWAKVRGYRTGDNPALWRGHLDQTLSAIKKKQRVKHHPALPFAEISDFMSMLKFQKGIAARALEIVILTATRTSEVIGARWSEFDLDKAIWTIPPVRMKAHREHKVPLQPRAVAILRELEKICEGEYVFAGRRTGNHLSNMALLAILKRMKHQDITVHGFRSTFRDWASECTSYPREVCEMALAHAVSDQVEAAYRRGDLFTKRQLLMSDWSKYCNTPKADGNVIPIRQRAPKKTKARVS